MLRLLKEEIVFESATELVVEIHSGEGGDDSKRFVCELAAAYARFAEFAALRCEQLTVSSSHIVLRVSGNGVWQAFRFESGKHCVQRYPPNERKGRRHTSLVVVAVLPLPTESAEERLDPRDIEVRTQGGSGPGGQHQNKTDSAVRMTHRPTGIQIMINGRDQHRNRRDALRILTAKVHEQERSRKQSNYSAQRKDQLGDSGRGNKVRTYNFIDGRVVDHRTGRKTHQIKQVMKGRIDLLRE